MPCFPSSLRVVATLPLRSYRVRLRSYDFVKLNEMEAMEPNKILDVIAVVKSCEDHAQITTR